MEIRLQNDCTINGSDLLAASLVVVSMRPLEAWEVHH